MKTPSLDPTSSPLIETVCPTDFRAFPDRNILNRVKADTQVLCWGENHANPFHAMWLLQLLPQLTRMGYTLAVEYSKHSKQDCDVVLKSGYHPHKTEGPIWDQCAAAADYKILRAANILKMPVTYIDDPEKDIAYVGETDEGVRRRNDYMTSEILSLVAQGSKILYWGGPYHLYSNARASGIPERLKQQGVTTFSVSNLTDRADLTRENDFEDLSRVDRKAALHVAKVFRKNMITVQENRPVIVNLHDYTKHAGVKCPDTLVVFSEKSSRWWDAHAMKTNFDEDNTAEEARVLDAIWRAHVVPERRAIKAKRLKPL